EGLTNLMADSLASFAAIFRAVLLVQRLTPPIAKHAIVAMTVQELKLDGTVFERIFNIRENNYSETLTEKKANDLFGQYMEQIEKVIDSVDAVDKRIAAA